MDSPLVALVCAALGSILSEALASLLVQRHHPWVLSLRRTLAYAGHHAVSAAAAWLVYQLVRAQVASPLARIHLWGALAYPAAYCTVSMALVWPHDWTIRFFVASDAEALAVAPPATPGTDSAPTLLPDTVAA